MNVVTLKIHPNYLIPHHPPPYAQPKPKRQYTKLRVIRKSKPYNAYNSPQIIRIFRTKVKNSDVEKRSASLKRFRKKFRTD